MGIISAMGVWHHAQAGDISASPKGESPANPQRAYSLKEKTLHRNGRGGMGRRMIPGIGHVLRPKGTHPE